MSIPNDTKEERRAEDPGQLTPRESVHRYTITTGTPYGRAVTTLFEVGRERFIVLPEWAQSEEIRIIGDADPCQTCGSPLCAG